MLDTECLRFGEVSFLFEWQKFLSCDVDMNFVKSGFIHIGVVITFNNYDEWNSDITLNNMSFEVLQLVYGHYSFKLSTETCFIVTLVQQNGKDFWFLTVQLLFLFNIQSHDKIFEKLAFAKKFEIATPIHIIKSVLIFL